MHMPLTAYRKLEARFRRISVLGDIEGMLTWDMATMMPAGAAGVRAEHLAAIKVLCHELLTDPEMPELLAEAEEEAGLESWERANLAEMRRLYLRASAVDAALTDALAKAEAECEMHWRRARPARDFEIVRRPLQALLDLKLEAAAAVGETLGMDRYDALIDAFEPGMRAAEIDRLFAPLIETLPGILARVTDAQKPPLPLEGPFPLAIQRDLGQEFMKILGFDFESGRLDISLHPFTGGASGDVRLTTRYDVDDFTRSLMGVLHETGHALYEQGLPADWRYQPAGRAPSMMLHESQSLLIEMQACRSHEFLTFAAPIIAKAFGRSGPEWSADNLYRVYTHVEPGAIRVDADEVTYPFHILLRYRLEKALISGDLPLKELPQAWNDGMKELLGFTPAHDGEGCLQDIHWYEGAFGYFPSYTLGAMAAAQLFQAACRAEPAIKPALAKGDFRPLVGWLRENVHRQGSRLAPADLIHEATGKPLDARAFLAHLEERYPG